ncbi:MAG: hypothetical protein ABSD75_28925 [Terriglobales bacterium]
MKDATISVAYHEAGHAVIAWRLHLLSNKGASVVPEEGSKGRVHHNRGRGDRPDTASTDSARARVERNVIVALADIEAQQKYSPSSVRSYHGTTDRDHAIDMLMFITEPTSNEFPVHIKLLKLRARNMVRAHWPQIEVVAARLRVSKTLTGNENSRSD